MMLLLSYTLPPTSMSSQRKLGPMSPLARGDSWVPAFAGMTTVGGETQFVLITVAGDHA
jgi:hypothetical protein